MMRDIERIVTAPEDEDRHWFPDIAGTKDVMAVLRDVWANYRDESFVSQYLSPRLIREMRMFQIHDDPARVGGIDVQAIQNERGYRRIRGELSKQYDVGWTDPNIEVVDVDLAGDRRLILHHTIINGRLLAETDAKSVLQHLADLWGYDVVLREINLQGHALKEHSVSPRGSVLAAA